MWAYAPNPWDYWPDDPPPAPDHLGLLVTSDLSVMAGQRRYGALSLLGATASATDTLGDAVTATGSLLVAPLGGVPGTDVYQSVTGRHLVRVPVAGGVARVSVGGHISSSVSDTRVLSDLSGESHSSADASVSAAAQIDNREVGTTTSVDGLPQNANAAANSDPTNRQLTGWASLNWKVQDDDSPSVPFYDGYAKYFLNATGFTPTSYAWQTNPAPFVQSQATPNDLIWQLPDASVSEKNFHFDLGDDFTQLPKSSLVRCSAAGTDPYLGAFSGAATVAVTWHSPWQGASGGGGGPLSLTPAAGADVTLGDGTVVSADTVTAGQTLLVSGQSYVILTVQDNADGTLTFSLAPTLPPDPQDGDDVMALADEYQARTQQAIQVGATLTGLGMETCKSVAEGFVAGPLYELASGPVIELSQQAVVLIRQGLAEGSAGDYFAAMAAKCRLLLPGLQQKVYDLAAGVANGTATDTQLLAAGQELTNTANAAAELDAAAVDSHSLANESGNLGNVTQEAATFAEEGPGRFSSNSMALGLQDHVKAFAGQAVIGLNLEVETSLLATIKDAIDSTVASGDMIRFDLDGFSTADVLNPVSENNGSYTSTEFRYVLDNCPGSTVFSRDGVALSSATARLFN